MQHIGCDKNYNLVPMPAMLFVVFHCLHMEVCCQQQHYARRFACNTKLYLDVLKSAECESTNFQLPITILVPLYND